MPESPQPSGSDPMRAQTVEPTTRVDPRSLPEDERLKSFGAALDAIKRRAESDVGEDDLRYVQRVNRVSRAAEVVGRVLIHVSTEPVSFSLGVLSLWVHKQLQATEIGHTVLHGAYDRIEGDHGFQSKSFYWDIPIDEESWRRGHNHRHHGSTNIAGRDPDIHFGPVRLTEHTPHRWYHYFQVPFALGVMWPNFTFLMNLHFTGLLDIWHGNGRDDQFDFIESRDTETKRDCYRRALRKYVPYYLEEYVFFPALAGPMFWKVMLGNWLASTMRDVYSAATIYCGHVGEDTARWDTGTKPKSRGHWYAMQVEASNNFEVPWLVSVFCGALDLQIEHHLFPRLPTQKLREVAPEVRAACEAHGIEYRSESWPRTLWKAIRRLGTLSTPEAAVPAPVPV